MITIIFQLWLTKLQMATVQYQYTEKENKTNEVYILVRLQIMNFHILIQKHNTFQITTVG